MRLKKPVSIRAQYVPFPLFPTTQTTIAYKNKSSNNSLLFAFSCLELFVSERNCLDTNSPKHLFPCWTGWNGTSHWQFYSYYLHLPTLNWLTVCFANTINLHNCLQKHYYICFCLISIASSVCHKLYYYC